jgi:hypothetical protein
MIISVSRRCDIPRFQFDWFLERLKAGYVDTANPFNAAQIRRVSLKAPGTADKGGPDTDAAELSAELFVFWTRDPRPLLECAEDLEAAGYRFYVMVTVTAYPALLEPNVPPPETVIAAMGTLAGKIGRERVMWRYDPVFLSSVTDFAFHRKNFRSLAGLLKGKVRRVIISRCDAYTRAVRRVTVLEQSGLLKKFPVMDSAEERKLLADLACTAREAGMIMQSCAEAEDLLPLGIQPGACIDGAFIKDQWGIEGRTRDKHQRSACRCAKSVDIGRYGLCTAGCVYCYAT